MNQYEMATGHQLVFAKKNFRIRLAELGIRSMVELARKAKIADSTMWQVSLGLIPGAETRTKIAAALGVEQADLWPAIPDHLISGGR